MNGCLGGREVCSLEKNVSGCFLERVGSQESQVGPTSFSPPLSILHHPPHIFLCILNSLEIPAMLAFVHLAHEYTDNTPAPE